MLRDGKVRSAQDFYYAAMIFQHGKTVSNYALAVALSRTSADLGNKNGKWLYARALDRFFLKIGLKQKFGTQFSQVGKKWILDPYDQKTTDKDRKEYGVPTIDYQTKVRAKQLEEEDK
ncbi:MAG: hypothetical protein WDZ67_00805 [Patescibacteria group bacterium]